MFLALRWEPVPAGPQEPAGSWHVLDDGTGLAPRLEAELQARGARISDTAENLLFLRTAASHPDQDLPQATQAHCQAFLDLVRGRPAQRLWLVTRGAQSVDGEAIELSLSPLWGAARAVRVEHPEMACTRLDLPRVATPEEVPRLVDALLSTGGEDELALRGSRRLAARLVRDPQPPGPVEPTFLPSALYLVTGGLGGLGLALARWLVARGARRLVLASRRGAWSPARKRAVEDLREAGAEVQVEALDVADRPALAELLGRLRTRGELRGVFHAAGVADVGLVVDQDRGRLEQVLRPKVSGAWNLHELTRQDPLDCFVLYSSVASLLASPGQSTYAAANAFLDGLAWSRRAAGRPVTCVNWTAFEDGGMSLGDNPERLRQTGMGTLRADQGARILGRLMATGHPTSLVLPLDLGRWLDYYPQGEGSSLLAGLAENRPTTLRGRVRTDLLGREPDARAQALRDEVFRRTARCLGLRPEQAVSPEATFQDQGLDSLMAVELRNGLERDLDLPLPVTLVFDHPTPERLARHLSNLLASPVPQAPPTGADPAGTACSPVRGGEVASAPAERAPGTAPEGHLEATTPAPRPETSARPQASARPEPIAVVGLGCRFPGGGHGPEAFWNLLATGVDAISTVPPERWDADAFWSPEPGTPGRMASRCGGFIPGPDLFDAAFFGISPREARAMDPQQRLLLETAWEALEHAGIPPSSLEGSATGVFVGLCSHDYEALVGHLEDLDAWAGTGLQASVAAGRLSYLLGLEGPSLVLDTACSSSLVAVHLAAQSLRAGECDLALAAGVNLVLSPAGSVLHSQTHSMAPDGRCKTFDAAADGFVRSDGCGVVVLKPLAAARRDGDRVLALLQGSATNQDGRSNGLTAPSGPAQEAVIRLALTRAGIPPTRVGFVEAHGTGTPLGDPIELNALGSVIGRQRTATHPLRVGAVKSNLGHPEGAAGVAGFIKAVLALRHRAIPPNLHLHHPTPHVDWPGLHLHAPTRLEAWDEACPRVAGVSAFGVSGTNAHVVLEESPEVEFPEDPRTLHLLPLSARDDQALRDLASGVARHLLEHPETPLAAFCRTAALGRNHFRRRLAVLGSTHQEMAHRLQELADAPPESAPEAREGLRMDFSWVGFEAPAAGRTTDLTLRLALPGPERAHLEEVARLYVQGARVDWATLHAPFPGPRADLPTYPFQRRSFWQGTSPRLPEAPVETGTGADGRIFALAWRPVPEPVPAGLQGTWVVLAADPEEPTRLLTAAGARVLPGDPWKAPDRILQTQPLRGVVLVCPRSVSTDRPPSARTCTAALGLAQALARHPGPGRPPVLRLVTRGACALPGEAPDLAQALVWGLGRVIMLEHPELDCRLVDLEPGASLAPLVLELAGLDQETQVAWRSGHRFGARLERWTRAPAHLPLRDDSTYLVTGGLGALGLGVARRFVERGARHLVLAGRHEPGVEARKVLEDLRQAGANVLVLPADVAHAEQVETLLATLEATMPPVRGVIHAAGVLDDGVLADLTPQRLERVLAPKTWGAWHLHRATRTMPLDFFVLFSSVAGLLGSAGQANYAAANAGLDALAAWRQAHGLPALALDWGPWQTGMGAGLNPAFVQRLAEEGLSLLEPEEGLDVLEGLLGEGGQAAVLSVDWKRLLQQGQGPVGALVRDLLPPEVVAVRQAAAQADASLAGASPERLRDLVHRHTARALGLETREVPLDRPLREAGLDSLMALELRNALAQATRLNLPVTLAFDYPTVYAMAAFLEQRFPGPSLREADGSESCQPETRPARPPAEPPQAPAAVPGRPGAPSAPQETAARIPGPAKAACPSEPIAVIGLGCRYPGGVQDPASFWRLLAEGLDAITEVPPERWDVEAWYDPVPGTPGRTTSRWGGFLTGIDLFDAAFFSIPPYEAERMDPQQRLLLETAWEALENAGIPPDRLAGSPTGVFVGLTEEEYGRLHLRDASDLDAWSVSGNSGAMASGRLSYHLGLQGPSMTVDTACSSSLVAVHLAMASLASGESDLALAGGVTLMLTPAVSVAASQSRLLACDGRCKPFDALADGLVWAEGCAVLVLKRLDQARRDGDPVLAVLRGSAVNQDGRSSGLFRPALEAVVRRALARAGVAPHQVDLVEAFGMGAAMGDAVEVQALAAVLAEGRDPGRKAWLGSVKSNLGHTMAASGVAGLIKTILALRHQMVPPSLHCANPTPHVDWEHSPLQVARRAVPWPTSDRPRVAGVSAFGNSGTNAHIIVSEAPAPAEAPPEETNPGPHLLVLSAREPEALRQAAGRLACHLREHTEVSLPDVAWTLATGRTHFEHRLALVGTEASELAVRLAHFAEGPRARAEGDTQGFDRETREPETSQRSGGPEQDDHQARLEALARRYLQGETVAWEEALGPRQGRRVELPTYPFQRRRYWLGGRA